MIEDPVVVSEILSDWNWKEVFKYAANPRFKDSKGFTCSDVKTIIAFSEGFNDGLDWIMLGQLYDNRYFFLYAGCDYTGWGCQEGGGSYTSNDLDDAIRFILADEDRERLIISLSPH